MILFIELRKRLGTNSSISLEMQSEGKSCMLYLQAAVSKYLLACCIKVSSSKDVLQ